MTSHTKVGDWIATAGVVHTADATLIESLETFNFPARNVFSTSPVFSTSSRRGTEVLALVETEQLAGNFHVQRAEVPPTANRPTTSTRFGVAVGCRPTVYGNDEKAREETE